VSPETLLKEPSVQAEASLFSSEGFDSYVMTTYGRFAIALERGLGCRVWDTEGREYLDFVAGIATCTLGHAHPAMIAAVTKQIQTLHHVSNLYYIPVQGELAKWLVDHSCADRAFF
jgi:acetylornithine/N-succinyldiaminopimelate aminotransferase